MPATELIKPPAALNLDFSKFNARWLASLPESERKEFLASLSKEEKLVLEYTWEFWARPEQLLPTYRPWQVWLNMAGRGYGKTRVGAETVRHWVEKEGVMRIGLIGQTAADVRDVIIQGESGLLAISPPWFRPKYEPTKRLLTWPNGAIASTYSGDEPDQLRGPQHEKVWADEPAKWKSLDETWDNMEMGLRLGANPQAVATTTPRSIKWIKDLIKDPGTVVTRGKTTDNAANLAESFMRRILAKYSGTRIGRQELDAEVLEDVKGALWNSANIEKYRIKRRELPPLKRIVVGVDPMAKEVKAITDDDDAETGIIVGGIDERGHGYIFGDFSKQGAPAEWGKEAVRAYNVWEADRMVAEINNGGAMVEYVIKSIDPRVSYKSVTASRGKFTRAEPVSALYEQGRVHHVDYLPGLEEEMCNWVPGGISPNRLDAMVWVVTELMLFGGKKEADVF